VGNDEAIADVLIDGDGQLVYATEATEVYVITGDAGRIVEITYKTFWAYVSKNAAIRKIIGSARYKGHQINPETGDLAVWYWEGTNGGIKE